MSTADRRRLTAWRFKVLRQAEERARNVAWTCRHFGISRKTFYKWKRRFAEHGEAGPCNRARTAHRSPNATPPDVVSKLLYLRQHYHFGAGKIADYLKRRHSVSVATSSVHRILGKHGLNRLPANQKHRAHATRWKRYEKPQPGHRLQLDVKFLERIPGTRTRLYQFTAIDDCTRIWVLKVSGRIPFTIITDKGVQPVPAHHPPQKAAATGVAPTAAATSPSSFAEVFRSRRGVAPQLRIFAAK